MSLGEGTRQGWAAEEAQSPRRNLAVSPAAGKGPGRKPKGGTKGKLEQAARWHGVISRFQN